MIILGHPVPRRIRRACALTCKWGVSVTMFLVLALHVAPQTIAYVVSVW